MRLVSTLDWRPLGEDDLVALAELATACLDIDGGLPLLAEEETLRRHYLSGVSIGGWDETGDLVAAASIFADGPLALRAQNHLRAALEEAQESGMPEGHGHAH